MGDIRITFDKDPLTARAQVIQEDNYYAYGGKVNGFSYLASNLGENNTFLYGGKEYQDGLNTTGGINNDYDWDVYDLGARMYDPILGKFYAADPHAGSYGSVSPYAYAFNDPLNFNDPTGKDPYNGNSNWWAPQQQTPYFQSNSSSYNYYNSTYNQTFSYNYSQTTMGSLVNTSVNFSSSGSLGKYSGSFGSTSIDMNIVRLEVAASMEGSFASSKSLTLLYKNTINDIYQSQNNRGPGLSKANSWLGYAGYAEGGVGAIQLGLLNYRQSLSLSSKVGTFGSFSSTYKMLSMTGKGLGNIGYLGAVTNTIIDYKSMQNGEIGGARFGYRTAGTLGSIGGSIGIGFAYGGPWGAIGGAVIGGATWAGEKMYDGFMYGIQQMSIGITNFENGLKNGWIPGKR